MLHSITLTYINRFWWFMAEMLLREYAIKWWFVIQLLLTNVFALPDSSMTLALYKSFTYLLTYVNINPGNCVFLVVLYTLSRKRYCFGLACYIFVIHQPILIFFVDNKVVLLSTVCKYYFSPSHFVFETRYTARLKRQFPGFLLRCFHRQCREIS